LCVAIDPPAAAERVINDDVAVKSANKDIGQLNRFCRDRSLLEYQYSECWFSRV
jgi:ethanolamine utilization microcompartment shell protein EutS